MNSHLDSATAGLFADIGRLVYKFLLNIRQWRRVPIEIPSAQNRGYMLSRTIEI